jgi:hypothetical protein
MMRAIPPLRIAADYRERGVTMSPISQVARKDLIEKTVKAHKPDGESLRLPWKEEGKLFPVVKVHVDALLLNPTSHRIRAQLESHPKRVIVQEDPFSEEAQDIIAGILREEEKFDDLLKNMDMYAQREAGVITREGLLVNANRRVVALRELRIEYARVAVLDDDALEPEIAALELYLQVAKDYRRDYTFTNELLFVEDLSTTYRKSADETALALGWAMSREERDLKEGRQRVEQATRLLAMIRSVQEASRGALVLTDFDDNRVALEEIDQIHERLKLEVPLAARKVRDLRLLGMIEGVQYRDLRWIDERFLEQYLAPAMGDSDILKDHIGILEQPSGSSVTDIPGLDILPPEEAADKGLDPSALLGVLASSAREETVELPSTEGPVARDREVVRTAIAGAIEEAVEEARTDSRRLDRLAAPSEELSKANRALTRALEAFSRVSDRSDFNLGKFKYLLRQVSRALEQIKDRLETNQ